MLVLFYRVGCPYCDEFLPEWDKFEKSVGPSVKKQCAIHKLDPDQSEEFEKTKIGGTMPPIEGVPTVRLFVNGKYAQDVAARDVEGLKQVVGGQSDAATDNFLEAVTSKGADAVARLFCDDGILLGTVSQIKRKKKDIKRYFDFFTSLPGLKVVDKKYNIDRVDDRVSVNNAFITWHWEGLANPIEARMTFVVRDGCIYELHSSRLPELNKTLLRVSKKR
jgi:hypothetical protein